jgi:galactonate dehydratase
MNVATTNFLVLEYTPDDEPPRRDLILEPLVVKDGYIEAPEKPGIGVDLNEELLLKYPLKAWHRPFLYGPDGSLRFQ